jgi:signal transduction histidine kinase
MLERLERAAAAQQQFVTDASHELRSPVAVIRSQVEVAVREADDADWPAVADRVLAEDSRLEAIVDDLLALAKGAAEPTGGRHVDVDLDDVVMAQSDRHRSAPVDTSAVHPARLSADPVALDRLIGHLLDNAARHGDQVVVGLRVANGHAVLTVDDDGAGVEPGDRERIFDRFTRLDASRARDRGGAGLGLPVVRQVAQHHGGTVEVSEGPGGGARLEVKLPLDPPRP